MRAHDLAQAMSTTYENDVLKNFTSDPDDSKWQPQIKARPPLSARTFSPTSSSLHGRFEWPHRGPETVW